MKKTMWIEENKEIYILSGEGTCGSWELYTGKKTPRAIRSRLTRERCNGDRWASAYQYSHTNEYGHVGRNLENDTADSFPSDLVTE